MANQREDLRLQGHNHESRRGPLRGRAIDRQQVLTVLREVIDHTGADSWTRSGKRRMRLPVAP